jgi:hypothetical protein
MSPSRGFIPLPRSVKSEGSIKSKMRADSGYEGSPVDDTDILFEAEKQRYSSRNWIAQSSQLSYHNHQHDTMPEDSYERGTSASVKSFSSGPSSRRDSAISDSSKHQRRPKTARQSSKQSLKPGRERSVSDLNSLPIRQRPRRSTTSPTGRLPTTNIEEALALHERSRQILAMATVSTPYQSAVSVAPQPPSLYRSTTTVDNPYQRHFDSYARSHGTRVEAVSFDEGKLPEDSFVPSTTTYWTSTETRRQDYARIDKANKGMRGLFRKIMPKFARTTSESRFFDEKDGSDTCSVRRYRLDLDDDEK